jgi:hypothetical protein
MVPPFKRVELHDSTLLVGARWWQEQIHVPVNPVARRSALLGISALVGLTALAGGCAVCVAVGASSSSGTTPSPDDVVTTRKDSLDTQKQYGWSFGDETEPLLFGTDAAELAYGETTPFDRTMLDRMATDLAPKNAVYRPFFVPTLFQSLTASPTAGDVSDDAPEKLRDVLKPIVTASMVEAFARGEALATLLENAPDGRAIMIDLPGPEAVAFAAGLSSRAEPVFTFDNWPHPKGVVPAHRTLAAAAYYDPFLVKRAAARPAKAPPAFVLDDQRLAPYSDSSDRFDNRYVARVPNVEALKGLGVKQLLYVRPRASDKELDDLNADLNAYREAGVDVRLVAADEFKPAPASDAGASDVTTTRSTTYYYGGSPSTHWWFWSHYGWGRPARFVSPTPPVVSASSYRPAPRATGFTGVGSSKVRPMGFSQEPVATSRSSGRVVGSSRSGSWSRSSGWTSS